MSDSTLTLVIQGDKAAVEQIREAVGTDSGNKAMTSEGASFTGSPGDWLVVCQIVISAVAAVSPIVAELVKQKRVSYAKVGEVELRGRELERFQAVADEIVESS